MSEITVYKAQKIVTMDPSQPVATHVAVRDGMILAVGGPGCAEGWGPVRHDDSLAHTVLLPGFVEGHAHMLAGAIWEYVYCGYHDRLDPTGKLHAGMTDIDAVLDKLRARAEALPEGAALVGWGFDPIFLPTERLSRHHLDQISPDRPIAIIFSNFHLLCANSKALEMAGYTTGTQVEGVVLDAAGHPTGELQEMAAMFPVMRRLKIDFKSLTQADKAVTDFAAVARLAGVTTMTDLYSSMDDAELASLTAITNAPDYCLRIVPVLGATGADPAALAARAQAYAAQSTDKLRMGAVKLMTDGSIQGWTARVKWPGYVGGQPNGIWNTPPEQIAALCDVMQAQGVQMHIHVNGDEASQVCLAALEAAARRAPWPGARHVLQHCQMMGPDQFRRAAELGVCTNIFSNHIWYFGDQHRALTIGEDRAMRMDAARSALDAGVHVALHSDAPVTPLGPLFTAWCAVNRRTMSGQQLGAAQCLTIDEALYAITLGAAYTLKLDDEIGSIECGKRADFAVLGADPLSVAPEALCDVPVLGTVFGGRVNLT